MALSWQFYADFSTDAIKSSNRELCYTVLSQSLNIINVPRIAGNDHSQQGSFV